MSESEGNSAEESGAGEESSGPDTEDDEQEAKRKLYTKDYDLHKIRVSTTERLVPQVDPPKGTALPDEEFWVNNKPNVKMIREHLKREGKLTKDQFTKLFDEAYEVLSAEDTVLYITAPLTICGDIHGQFFDLLKLFEVGGDPEKTRYLFLGDYVDRGNFSIECVILLFSCKVAYPNSLWLLRGNHECRHLTEYFTFKEECKHKYGSEAYDLVMDTFDALPLCAVLNKQFFCVHGGLSPGINKISQIAEIDRFVEPVSSGSMCDLLWADPMEDFTTTAEDKFEVNTVRGCSFFFSYSAVCDFLESNKLLSVIRAHEAQDAGYKMHRRIEKTGFPSVITLFSAPNYLDSYNNKAAILRYENNVINIRQFNSTPHPYYLPGFMDVFSWSLPFVAEKVADLLLTVLRLVNDVEADAKEKEQRERDSTLRKKIQSVGRMASILKNMREEREQIVLAGPLSPRGTSLPSSLTTVAGSSTTETIQTLTKSLHTFEGTKAIDIVNEARPPDFGRSPPQSPRRRSSKSSLSLRFSQSGSESDSSTTSTTTTTSTSTSTSTTTTSSTEPEEPSTPRIREEKIEQ